MKTPLLFWVNSCHQRAILIRARRKVRFFHSLISALRIFRTHFFWIRNAVQRNSHRTIGFTGIKIENRIYSRNIIWNRWKSIFCKLIFIQHFYQWSQSGHKSSSSTWGANELAPLSSFLLVSVVSRSIREGEKSRHWTNCSKELKSNRKRTASRDWKKKTTIPISDRLMIRSDRTSVSARARCPNETIDIFDRIFHKWLKLNRQSPFFPSMETLENIRIVVATAFHMFISLNCRINCGDESLFIFSFSQPKSIVCFDIHFIESIESAWRRLKLLWFQVTINHRIVWTFVVDKKRPTQKSALASTGISHSMGKWLFFFETHRIHCARLCIG